MAAVWAAPALLSESPANAARWLGSLLHFVEDTGSPPHAAEIRGPLHIKMENWIDAGKIGQRREQIDRAGDLRNAVSFQDVAGPANEQRRADAAFVGRAFAAFHTTVPAPTVRPIVGEIDHDRVVGQFQLVELFQHAADVPIDVLAHRQRRPREVSVFLRRIVV